MDELFDPGLLRRLTPPVALPTGAYHVPGWLTPEQQRGIAREYRRWAQGPVPPHSARIFGHEISVSTLCLGWHWSPYRYTRTAIDVNGHTVLAVPDWVVRMGRQAVAAALADEAAAAAFTPDAVLANWYASGATMGMHQDKEEQVSAPVVSVSVGDACTFRFGNPETRNRPYQDLELRSGDLFVFTGASRFAFHGVRGLHPDTAPADCGITGGRLNLTLRETGLT